MTLILDGTLGVSGVAGSASAPAVVGSDADSGYYINSANEPSASVNGTAVWNAASTFGFKNRIINGNMAIDQRNAGGLYTSPASNTYQLDRWCCNVGGGGFNVQQNASSVTPPAGFANYYGVVSTSTTAASNYSVRQFIEGFNTADLMFGTASAQTVTLSFWVRSSLTGTFGGALQNSAGSRSYVYSYTINSANTWEYKTVTIPGDTGGTWIGATNGAGLVLYISYSVASGQAGGTGAWTGNDYRAPTGQTNVVGTNGATFYITGVQLEKGSTATSFDFRDYGRELAMCQRYFQKSYSTSTAVGAIINDGPGIEWLRLTSSSDTRTVYFRTEMRADPTITLYQPRALNTTGVWWNGSGATTLSLNVAGQGTKGWAYEIASGSTSQQGYGAWTASAEL